LLATGAIEVKQLIDRRHLPHQQNVVGAMLIDGVGAGPRHPTDLALGLGHELFDAMRRGFGLLGHRCGQRRLGLAIDEPSLDRAVDGQHENHQSDQRHHVFGKKAALAEPVFAQSRYHLQPRTRTRQNINALAQLLQKQRRRSRTSSHAAS
jgi:hypothetical protein